MAGSYSRLFAIGLSFAALAVPLCGYAAETPERPLAIATQNAIAAAVNAELKAYGGKTPVPGAVVGVWDPKLGFMLRGFGRSDIAANKPMAADDKFRIGSNTKTFVITVLLQLADE